LEPLFSFPWVDVSRPKAAGNQGTSSRASLEVFPGPADFLTVLGELGLD
jgi:hypothetical protein